MPSDLHPVGVVRGVCDIGGSFHSTVDVMTYWMLEQKKERKGDQFVGCNDRLRQSVCHNTSRREMEIPVKIRNQRTFHVSSEEAILESVDDGSDRQGERHRKGVKAKRPTELLAVQLGAPICDGG